MSPTVSAESSTESMFEPVTRPDDESAAAGDAADVNATKPAQPSVRSSRFIEILASCDLNPQRLRARAFCRELSAVRSLSGTQILHGRIARNSGLSNMSRA